MLLGCVLGWEAGTVRSSQDEQAGLVLRGHRYKCEGQGHSPPPSEEASLCILASTGFPA